MARVVAWIEPMELNPRGAASYRDLVTAIVERYRFMQYPQKLEEFDEGKGITFGSGQFDGTDIEQLVIYSHGIVLDTRVSTQVSRKLLEEALIWASKEHRLTYKPSMITRWQYASQLTFHSRMQMSTINPAVERLLDSVNRSVQEQTGEALRYETTALIFDHDPFVRKNPFGRFSIQRRDGVPFKELKYFSDAPLPTDVHWKLVQQFEYDLQQQGKS
jgi:hypothetical protein